MASIAMTIVAMAAIFARTTAQPRTAVQQGDGPTIELWLGGDVNLGDGGRGQLQGISGIVQGATGIVNLEGPVVERSELLPGPVRLWNSPSVLNEIAALNVKVAGIANNHSGDAGKTELERRAEAIRQHGIQPAGGAAGPAVLRMNAISIAVTAHDLTHGVPANLQTELKAARAKADILIATFHVTGPPSYLPRPELRHAVQMAYAVGASVIVAHGTHAIGPVERREHAVIAWGLGNLAFACDCTQEQDAILLRVRVAPDKTVQAAVVPIQAGINHQPALPSKDAQGIFDLLEAIGSSKLIGKGDRADF